MFKVILFWPQGGAQNVIKWTKEEDDRFTLRKAHGHVNMHRHKQVELQLQSANKKHIRNVQMHF